MISKNLSLYADLRVFLIITTTLILISCLFVYSASSVYALETFGTSLFFVKRQLCGLVLGLIALCIGRTISINLIKKTSTLFFLSSLLLLVLTLIPSLSRNIHGSSRWLTFFKFSFQPSEIVKISLIIYLARFLEKKVLKKYISFFQKIFFSSLIAIMCLLLLKQPDFGMTITLLATTILLFFVAYANVKQVFITFLMLKVSAFFLIIFRSYRLQRLLTFLDPWQDPKGSGFQIIQSLIAIGSGGWFGTGIAHSRQKFFYLPMQHTDFIFSIIAEETGFIGSSFIIILFILFLYFGIRIAQNIKDPFGAFVVIGFVILITLQALMNLAVVTGLAPTKGVGLPFISYGNTALVCSLFMIGIIINIVHENKMVRQ